ncbi:bifunctional YncE family protein/alkaline phosphatase family protein [Paraburkholderia rhizosphaerae]|uniref:DNA-binding beta-propeller fold protein YncE n=1 Tax=Paraburkholderia rhizosphaerae TaxID=480658 RepID=A0A4R8LC51_9BURK|nr:bifunctional YncE family protein/alkaline phosphatase family protein [Paraburkholderia rhizosphaerae]TDY40546.1 DNA-binding beta-propeller fold protein YncE [Paraburkholderia rhizosphaerae]
MNRNIVQVGLAAGLITSSLGLAMAAPQGNMELLPTGQFISPMAIPGAVAQLLNPQLSAKPTQVVSGAIKSQLSPDGNTLAVITAGYNTVYTGSNNATLDTADSTQYIFIYDVSGRNKTAPKLVQAIHQNNAFDGLVWNGNKTLYGTGGADDKVYVYSRASTAPSAQWAQTAAIGLNHSKGIGSGVKPNAGGLALSADGRMLVVANNYNDSISIIDTSSNTLMSEYDLRPFNTSGQQGVAGGEYPWAVSLKSDGTAFVSSVRDREVVVLNLANPAAPRFIKRIPVQGNAYGMSLSPDESKLYVAVSNADQIAVIDTARHKVDKTIDLAIDVGNGNGHGNGNGNGHGTYSGRDTVNVTVSRDGRTLYAVNNGDNSIAVISHDGNNAYHVEGFMPTAYAPKDITISADGSQMYIINGKSVTGPNPLYTAQGVQAQYQFGLEQSTLLSAPLPRDGQLDRLTSQVDENNHYSEKESDNDRKTMKFMRDHIRHVIYVVKENRTFDQILGDLGNGADADPTLTMYGKSTTPNFHNIAQSFVTIDHFMDPGDGSMDGWSWVQHGHITPTEEVSQQENYAGVNRGMSYETEGDNRGLPVGLATTAARDAATNGSVTNATSSLPGGAANALPGIADISVPDAPFGYQQANIYDAVLAAGGTVRNYGGMVNNVGSIGTIASPLLDPAGANIVQAHPIKPTLVNRTDEYYRGFDQAYPDTFRELEWNREFQQYVKNGGLPSFELVRMGSDHTGSFTQNVGQMGSAEQEEADNDFAVGKLIETVANSPYARDTMIVVVEDDSQAGSDHVDSHRSTAYVVGPYVKKHAVVSTNYTQVDAIRTMEDLLGTPHIDLNTAYAKPMTDLFDTRGNGSWTYTAVASTILKGTNVGNVATGSTKSGNDGNQFAQGPDIHPLHDATYWADATKDFDFSKEDRIPPELFNHVLWKGVMGNKPYPEPHSIYTKVSADGSKVVATADDDGDDD